MGHQSSLNRSSRKSDSVRAGGISYERGITSPGVSSGPYSLWSAAKILSTRDNMGDDCSTMRTSSMVATAGTIEALTNKKREVGIE